MIKLSELNYISIFTFFDGVSGSEYCCIVSQSHPFKKSSFHILKHVFKVVSLRG